MANNKVTPAEVDQAFYNSYRDDKGNLDARLVDPGTGKPRKLTMAPADKQFRKDWLKTRKHLQELKGCTPPSGGAKLGSVTTSCPAASAKVPGAPPYEPDKWNKDPGITGTTNCYAYAMNSRTGHISIPQPGVKSGKPIGSIRTHRDDKGRVLDSACPEISSAVLSDGKADKKDDPDSIQVAPQCPYQKQNKLPPPEKPGYYLVLLVITSRQNYDHSTKTYYESDYHWFRQDDNGLWSQKQGTTPVKNTDESPSPNLIANPETCNKKEHLGNRIVYDPVDKRMVDVPVVLDYDMTCGYFYVKKGGAHVE